MFLTISLLIMIGGLLYLFIKAALFIMVHLAQLILNPVTLFKHPAYAKYPMLKPMLIGLAVANAVVWFGFVLPTLY